MVTTMASEPSPMATRTPMSPRFAIKTLCGVSVAVAALSLSTLAVAADETKKPTDVSVPSGEKMSAEEIVKTAYDRNAQAYSNIKAGLKMTLTTAKGEKKVRDLEIRGVRVD